MDPVAGAPWGLARGGEFFLMRGLTSVSFSLHGIIFPALSSRRVRETLSMEISTNFGTSWSTHVSLRRRADSPIVWFFFGNATSPSTLSQYSLLRLLILHRCRNVAGEATAYLKFIIDYYDDLPKKYAPLLCS